MNNIKEILGSKGKPKPTLDDILIEAGIIQRFDFGTPVFSDEIARAVPVRKRDNLLVYGEDTAALFLLKQYDDVDVSVKMHRHEDIKKRVMDKDVSNLLRDIDRKIQDAIDRMFPNIGKAAQR